MMAPDDAILIAELRRDEAVRRNPYPDSEGIPTIGVGHNLEASPLPEGWAPPLSDEQIDQLLVSDLLSVFSGLDAHLGWWRMLTYPRQRVLANMAFNLGLPRLMGFKNAIRFMEQGAYADSAKEMLSSKWARQVGERADRLAKMMVQG